MRSTKVFFLLTLVIQIFSINLIAGDDEDKSPAGLKPGHYRLKIKTDKEIEKVKFAGFTYGYFNGLFYEVKYKNERVAEIFCYEEDIRSEEEYKSFLLGLGKKSGSQLQTSPVNIHLWYDDEERDMTHSCLGQTTEVKLFRYIGKRIKIRTKAEFSGKEVSLVIRARVSDR